MHVIEIISTAIIFCFITATILGLVSAIPKPAPMEVPDKPISQALR